MTIIDVSATAPMDSTPTAGSLRAVTSDGIYNALQGVGGAQIISNTTASSWTADSTYGDFAYRCAIPISGVTANDVVWVVFSLEQVGSREYAPVCESYNGGVYIWSTTDTSITIPTIVVFKG